MTSYREIYPKDDNPDLSPGRVAFWPYDRFPFLIGAEIIEEYKGTGQSYKGLVRTVGYSGYFKPRFTLAPVIGKMLLGSLRDLRDQYRQELEAIDDRYKKMAVMTVDACREMRP